MIKLKTIEDINYLHEGGKILAEIHDRLEEKAVVGCRLIELDKLAYELIISNECKPAFLNYAPRGHKSFPATLCTSVNNIIVHGIPTKYQLRDGDMVGLDLGIIYRKKYYLDAARTHGIGEVTSKGKKLLAVTKQSLALGIKATKIGNTIGDIGAAIQKYVETNGFGVVRQLVGHGVGFDVHEDPQVPNYGTEGQGEKIAEGLVIAIEPMVTIGDPSVKTVADGWGVMVETGELTAHQEHTVAVTANGPLILT